MFCNNLSVIEAMIKESKPGILSQISVYATQKFQTFIIQIDRSFPFVATELDSSHAEVVTILPKDRHVNRIFDLRHIMYV